MVLQRKIPQITFAEHPDQGRKCWISLSGCNFDCKACISTAKQGMGRALSVVDILVKIDLKAYDENIHKRYTGKSNANVLKAIELLSNYAAKLHKYGPSFIVRTVFMPDIVDGEEIEKIAKFVSQIDKDVCYRIQQFSPVHGQNITRRPTFEKMLTAYNIAKKYLDNVIVSTYLPTRPEYNYVEVRADELIDEFFEIDRKSKSVIDSWAVKYFTMNQILNFKERKWGYIT